MFPRQKAIFRLLGILCILILAASSCKREPNPVTKTRYFQVGMKDSHADWRDSAFVVATSNTQLVKEVETQLKLPVAQRKIVSGALVAGSGGYNKNGSHEFKWHLKEDDWNFTDASIEVQDGRPYSDVDADTAYYIHNVKRYASWGSYIKKEITVN